MKLILVDKGVRFINYLIDLTVIVFITLVVFSIASLIIGEANPIFALLLFQCLYFSYYFIFELLCNQTLGKMATRTMVVHKSGRKPSTSEIFFRSLFRIATIDVLSFALGSHIGIHDTFSNTRVVKLPNVHPVTEQPLIA